MLSGVFSEEFLGEGHFDVEGTQFMNVSRRCPCRKSQARDRIPYLMSTRKVSNHILFGICRQQAAMLDQGKMPEVNFDISNLREQTVIIRGRDSQFFCVLKKVLET
jgi:hypothetical protein